MYRPRMMKQQNLIAAVILASLTVAAGGCAPTYTDYSAFVREPKPMVTSKDYVLAPPDNVVVYSKRVREINGHREQIRPDGRITLPLLGDVFVVGKTCEQISAELAVLAQEYYEDADVTVWVTAFNSQKVFVFGEVAAPGPYSYNGGNTVMSTLSRAQPTRLSDPSKITVLRPNSDGDLRKRMTIDMDKMVKEGDTTLDVVLEEGDVIYVPPNPLAAVGLAFQQLLLPIQPAASTVKGPTEIDQSFSQSPYNSPN